MAKEHFEALKNLRDLLVDERRDMVAHAFSDSEMRREAAGEFMGLQQFIDMVERAMQHEATLDRPPPKLPAMPESRRRES
jgi:hypothetical protein